MRKTAVASVIAAALTAISPTVAQAHTKHHLARCNVPKLTGLTLQKARARLKHAHCRTGTIIGPRAGTISTQVPKAGRHERHGAKVVLVLTRQTTTPTPTGTATTTIVGNTTYSTSVDPTFTQNPSDPLQVTYAVSADAVETVNGVTTNLAQTGQLPAGVLNFYSATTAGGPPSALQCSMNVGASVDGGSCTVTYPATGTYQVVTEYIPSGVTAVQQTEQEAINPLATTTSFSDSAGPVVTGQGEPFYDLGIAWSVQAPDGTTISPAGAKVTYQIIDENTQNVVANLTGNAGENSCYMVVRANADGTFYVDGASCSPQVSGELSYSDSYEIRVQFPGLPGYMASTSGWQAL